MTETKEFRRFRLERASDSLIGSGDHGTPGEPSKFAFAAPARFWFDKRPDFNYRVVAIEIEETA